MSFTTLPQPRSIKPGARLAIIAARFNEHFVNALLGHCLDELERLDPSAEIEVQRVPGSFEIPLAVQELILRADPKPDAVIAIGIVFEGETGHALLISQSLTQALQTIGLEQAVPVINQVLLLSDEAQAQARCFGDEINRGTEAARAAMAMIDDLRRIRRERHPNPRA